MPAGRPTKLTPELILSVCLCILEGNFRSVAAKKCGIKLRTLRHWFSQGKKFPDGLYGQFLHSVIEAEAEAESKLVGEIVKAAGTDWHAAIAWLERKFPERWGRYRGELVALRKRIDQLEARAVSGEAEYPETGRAG